MKMFEQNLIRNRKVLDCSVVISEIQICNIVTVSCDLFSNLLCTENVINFHFLVIYDGIGFFIQDLYKNKWWMDDWKFS